jgi:hypothetical protein
MGRCLQLPHEAQLDTCISNFWIVYKHKLTMISQLGKCRNNSGSDAAVPTIKQRDQWWNSRPNRLAKFDFTLALAVSR